MKLLLRLLTLLRPFGWQVALASILGCATVASNIGLLGMAAYLLAAAALAPLLILLTLPIYLVRLLAVARAVSRYTERLVAHEVTFRLLAQLRVWVYSRLEPLAPAGLLTYRSGDVLTRLVADVEELQHVYLRVVSPFLVAVLIALLTFGLFALFSPVLAWVALTAHGANYIAVKTEGTLNARARRIARIAWLITIVLTVLGTLATFSVQPAIIASFGSRPWEIIFPLIALGGLLSMGYFNIRQRDLAAFFSSCAFMVGLLASAAVSLYPIVLPATIPANSLTIYNASASQYAQAVGLVWWSIGMVLAIIYFVLTYRLFWGKVRVTQTEGY
jgi:Cytochrome bd terminal oxidase subunit II